METVLDTGLEAFASLITSDLVSHETGTIIVFNTMLLNTRKRMHDLATMKALSMSPGRVVGLVVSSVLFTLDSGLDRFRRQSSVHSR